MILISIISTSPTYAVTTDKTEWDLVITGNIHNPVWEECSKPVKTLRLAYKGNIVAEVDISNFPNLENYGWKNIQERRFFMPTIKAKLPFEASDYLLVDWYWQKWELIDYYSQIKLVNESIFFPDIQLMCDGERYSEIVEADRLKNPKKYDYLPTEWENIQEWYGESMSNEDTQSIKPAWEVEKEDNESDTGVTVTENYNWFIEHYNKAYHWVSVFIDIVWSKRLQANILEIDGYKVDWNKQIGTNATNLHIRVLDKDDPSKVILEWDYQLDTTTIYLKDKWDIFPIPQWASGLIGLFVIILIIFFARKYLGTHYKN